MFLITQTVYFQLRHERKSMQVDVCAVRDEACYGFGFLLISTAAPSSPPCSPLCYPVTRTHPAQTCTTLYKLCLSTLLFTIRAFLPLVNISATYSTTILKCTILNELLLRCRQLYTVQMGCCLTRLRYVLLLSQSSGSSGTS